MPRWPAATALGLRPGTIVVDPDPEPGAINVTSAWVGGVTSTGASVKARCADSATLTLRYATNEALIGATSVAGTEGGDEVFAFTLSGLSANTRYYYGFTNAELAGSFKTFPTEGSQASFTVAAASCAGGSGAQYVTGPTKTSNSPAFDKIRARDPAVFIHTGDRHYRDISTNNVPAFRTAYRDVISNNRQKLLHLYVPVAYSWSDHDYGANDSTGASASRPAARQVYREHVPYWPLDSAGAIYQKFTIGRVLFILLDCHSERSANGAPDTPEKSMLGTEQKQWLKDTLLAADEKVIVISISTPWTVGGSTWQVFPNERQELAEFFEDNDLTSRIFLLAGDFHFNAADAGTNTQFDPDAVTPGPPVVVFAPLDANFTTSYGTYSEGIHKDRKQQYGTLHFADNGDEIVLTAKGWAVTDATEAEQFSLVVTYDGT